MPAQTGPMADAPIRALAAMLTAVEEALQAENVDNEVIKRVRNRIVWGHPDGADATLRVTPEDIRRAFRVTGTVTAHD